MTTIDDVINAVNELLAASNGRPAMINAATGERVVQTTADRTVSPLAVQLAPFAPAVRKRGVVQYCLERVASHTWLAEAATAAAVLVASGLPVPAPIDRESVSMTGPGLRRDDGSLLLARQAQRVADYIADR